MQVTVAIHELNQVTKCIDTLHVFTLIGAVADDCYDGLVFGVCKILMDGTEISGDEFMAEIKAAPCGAETFLEMMLEKFQVAQININTTSICEEYVDVPFIA